MSFQSSWISLSNRISKQVLVSFIISLPFHPIQSIRSYGLSSELALISKADPKWNTCSTSHCICVRVMPVRPQTLLHQHDLWPTWCASATIGSDIPLWLVQVAMPFQWFLHNTIVELVDGKSAINIHYLPKTNNTKRIWKNANDNTTSLPASALVPNPGYP